jgi:hypothetical protein
MWVRERRARLLLRDGSACAAVDQEQRVVKRTTRAVLDPPICMFVHSR